jgi:hypothetical protein
MSATGLGDDQAFRSKACERCPSGRLGEAEPVNELAFGHGGPGRELELDDRGADALAGGIGGAGVRWDHA